MTTDTEEHKHFTTDVVRVSCVCKQLRELLTPYLNWEFLLRVGKLKYFLPQDDVQESESDEGSMLLLQRGSGKMLK